MQKIRIIRLFLKIGYIGSLKWNKNLYKDCFMLHIYIYIQLKH